MSDLTDLSSVGVGAGGVGGGALLLWFAQRLLKRVDKKEEEDENEVKAALIRIEMRLNDVHIEQRVQGGRITALEKTVEHVQERINAGLSDHRIKLEGLTERVVRVETRLEDCDE
jgi:hypothetical protein